MWPPHSYQDHNNTCTHPFSCHIQYEGNLSACPCFRVISEISSVFEGIWKRSIPAWTLCPGVAFKMRSKRHGRFQFSFLYIKMLLTSLFLLVTGTFAGSACPAPNRYCVYGTSDGKGNAIITVHSSAQGWAALGSGTSMASARYIIGWKNGNS